MYSPRMLCYRHCFDATTRVAMGLLFFLPVAFDVLRAERAPVNACRLPALTCSCGVFAFRARKPAPAWVFAGANIINVFRRHEIRCHIMWPSV